jgi:hypothetical protein
MRFIRNWVVPVILSGFFALLGFMLIGLPGVNLVTTLDGQPMPDGIPPEQISTIIAEGKKIGSYMDFYGAHLPGEPLYWTIGVIVVMAFIGYRLGAKLRVQQVKAS